MVCGIWGSLLIICLLSLPVVSLPRAPLDEICQRTCESGLSSSNQCIDNLPGPLEIADDQAIYFSLLQADTRNFPVNVIPRRSQVAVFDNRDNNFLLGFRTMLLFAIPLLLVQLCVSWPLCAWFEFGRRRVLSDHVFQKASKTEPLQNSNQQDREMPPVLAWFIYLGTLLLSIDYIIVMPASEETMVRVGGTTFLSGFAIGAWCVGSLLSLPIAIYLSRHSYKGAVILLAVFSCLGNIAYVLAGSGSGRGAITGLILARLVNGFEGGATIVFYSAVLHLTSGAPTVKSASIVTFVGCLGYVVGPVLSSLSQISFPSLHPEVPPAVLMGVVAWLYGICAVLWMPSHESCKSAGLPGHQCVTAEESDMTASDVQLRRSWLCLGVICAVQITRACQQVAWEAGALLVLVKEYGYSQRQAGLFVAIPPLLSLSILRSLERLQTRAIGAIRKVGLLALLTMLLMFRIRLPHTSSLFAFMVGSSCFYAVNWFITAPFMPWRKELAINGHWALNVETSTTIAWGVSFIGYFYGPVLIRAVLSACPSQNLLASSCIVMWAGACLAVEVGVHLLQIDGKECA